MIRVGLTGGYATSKTFVASELERLGCHVIYADVLGHTVLEPGGAAYNPAVELFGSEILDKQGAIDRRKLAGIVFQSPELLEKLTGIVHPAVFRLEEQTLHNFAKTDPLGIAVIEAAILVETGRYKLLDRLIVTACDEQTQIARGMKRDRATREEVLARLRKQLPLEEKKLHAHYVIDTSGEKEETVRQVKAVYADLRQIAQDVRP
ncbi:MAG: dephospho-CoA kinase [Acidobacteriota bacterium]|nr:dephospho-CoA kinase [Acidobacteriota bacterium]